MSGTPVVFSSVMWAPSDKYGPLVTRRRGSGTVSHAVRGTQPCIASRRNSVDARARRSVCTASNTIGHAAQPEAKAPKSVRWLLDEYKFPTEEPQEVKIRMPVPVPVKSSVSKSASNPPACRPFHILELPVYHPEDVRAELNGRLLKTLNDVVPLSQVYPIMAPAAVHIQHELYAVSHELANTTTTRLVFIADNLPDILRRIRRLTNNVLVLATPATQDDANRLQALANAARQIRKTAI
ncbi:hypothetical protein RSOL_513280 [Rhizoctonia solani AG-3 Rhs1AP]|uniref:Uncharacterized protein n=1 Tax=Rhizoctonia solani AG-3 Rhs1AP TaxID=1086054 RepID=X8JMQ4_9AGAM|nr:hypothetical protein RSOL_513280 [Rhizoctonia solani AG-3 Rhs1AP]